MGTEFIEEKGIVQSVGDGVVQVEIRQPYCEKVGKCTACACGSDGRVFIRVETDLTLKEGQEVTLQIKQAPILAAVFFVFVLPVLCLLIGMVVGDLVFGSWGLLLGVALCVGSFFLIFLYERHLRVTKKAEVRILEGAKEHGS